MFGVDVNNQILEKAKLTNEEICGYIIDNTVVFTANAAADKENSFEIKNLPDNVQAIFHSHPGGPFFPSREDMEQQIAMDIPWGIACTHTRHNEVFWFGDGAPKAPLIGRGFRHGVTDCFSLVRDFYKEVHDIHVEEFARDWEWWHNDERLYEDGFTKAGFYEISKAELQPGDGFIASIRSKTPNHAGIYLGNGLILHHTCAKEGYQPDRLSVVEPAARWIPFLTKVLRHENDQIDRTVGQKIWPRA